MRVLVTGSEGFIGTHLLRALEREKGIYPLSFDLKSGQDVRRDELPEAEIIVHLAAHVSSIESVEDPLEDFQTNAYGTVRVLEHARKLSIPVIYASSCKVYGAYNGGRTPYGASKLAGDVYCQEYRSTYGLTVVSNRFSTVYGPGQEGSPECGWLSWLIKCAKEDSEFTLFGDGKQTRDPVWIDDVIDLLVKQIRAPEVYNQTWDVGSGHKNVVSILSVIHQLDKLSGRLMKVNRAPARPSDLHYFAMRNKIPNWQPTVMPAEGIRRLWEAT